MTPRRSSLERAKRERRRRKIIWGGGTALLVGGLIVFGWWFSHSAKFLITTIEVKGTIAISEADVEAKVSSLLAGNYLFIFPRHHSFWYPQDEITALIKRDFLRASEVQVRREGFTKLVVLITERVPALLACAERCFFADDKGLVYAPAPLFSGPVYLIWDTGSTTPVLGETIGSAQTFKTLQTGARYFNEVFKHLGLSTWQATHIFSEGDGDYTLVFTDQASERTLPILIAEKESPTSSAKNLDLALTRIIGTSTPASLPHLEYVDLRFGKKVFYKL